MSKINWKISEQHAENKIKENNTWTETKTLTSRDIDRAICEICGISNHQENEKEENEEDINIIVFANGNENIAFCDDCLYNLN
ncbi:MAG: hypothetical protein I3273_06245 [Candidatus Moeniiplasma glomeromycotorum]|nr:hypothetical protein [Candidatus Moeniiplasma glomeromycotorum]MCE8168017.1 hypothetical protein [Candidatus Moeniiplasma glomeromycotorum]MCE8169685.1 hypothetical protein [Candidatus Moeniiplasma glomeromycotorum]